ncbi:hypothetical protein Ancab_032144 [Ancistrocladus abbreviatus]
MHPLTTIHHNITAHAPRPSAPPPSNTVGSHKMLLHTAFFWGKDSQFLFPGWPGTSTAMYVVALLFVFALAVLVECLSHIQIIKPGSNRIAAGFFRTGLHAVRAGLHYLVILAVISYNGGVFIAALVGHCRWLCHFRKRAAEEVFRCRC